MGAMTREQYDELIAQARSLNIPCPERWAWNRAAILGLHPELSGISCPPQTDAERRQSEKDWHDDLTITRDWLARKP